LNFLEFEFFKFRPHVDLIGPDHAPLMTSPTFRAVVVAPPPESDDSKTLKRFTLKIFERATDPIEATSTAA
jgi:hypothetical protein